MQDEVQQDWLDARLREEAPYIDDAGFTARVTKQLPARRRSSRSLRAAILLFATLVASVIAYRVSGRGAFLASAAEFVVAMPPLAVVMLAIFCGVIVTVLAVSAGVVSNARERRL